MLDRECVLAVYGGPAPKGSLKCVGGTGRTRGRHQLIEDNARTKPWRDRVSAAARKVFPDAIDQPVGVEITFTIDRPPSHYRQTFAACACGVSHSYCQEIRKELSTGPLGAAQCCPDCRHPRLLSAAGIARPYPSKRATGGMGGDIDKLARVILDALEDAGTYTDDAAVCELTVRKTYPDGPHVLPDALTRPGARIRLYPL